MKRLTRRQFIQAGLAGAALLAAVQLVDRPRAQAPGLRNLDARTQELLLALVPVVLAGALPAGGVERTGAIGEIVEAFDRALSGLDRGIQEEIAQMLGLLVFAPTRIAVAGVWPAWPDASAAEVAAFLSGWRDSRLELKRSGYRALTQLIQAAWYDNAEAWRLIGYPGPPPAALAGTS